MPLPTGIQLCTLTFGGDTDMGGNPLAVQVTVTPSTDLVWKATGQRLGGKNFPQTATAPAGSVTTGISMPATDQAGFADGNGNDVLNWFYVVTAEYSNNVGRETVTKNWQPVVGQAFTDFDMIPSGPATPGFTAPTGVVTSVNGQTGAVTVAASGNDTAAVHYTADSPTTTQQTRARTNLGLAPVAATGSYNDLNDRPTVGTSPWQFRPETYGAKGDGKIVDDVAVTNGSNVITSPAKAAFTAADVGKWVMIQAGQSNVGAPLITTITGVTNSTTATLAAPATNTATGCPMVYATDDTAAINSTVTAARTYAEANSYAAEITFSDRIYGLAAVTQQTGPTYNTQIKVPVPTNQAGRKLTIRFVGVERADHCQHWAATVPAVTGSALVSFATGPATVDATYGRQSILGGPNTSTGITGNFVNTKVVLENLSIWSHYFTNLTAFDFSWIGGCHVDGYSSHIFSPPVTGTGPHLQDLPGSSFFTTRLGCAGVFPTDGNNDDITVGSIACEGYSVAFQLNDHLVAQRIAVIYCDIAVNLNLSAGLFSNNHTVSIQSLSCEYTNQAIYSANVGGNGYIMVDIWVDGENIFGSDLFDSGNQLHGTIHWTDITRSSGQPIVTGGGNVRIINEKANRGPQTAPAVPATTVALLNPFWRDATVRVTGGTVTVIAVDGQTVATATGATVTVPTGKSITLTYSAAPTWTWSLL